MALSNPGFRPGVFANAARDAQQTVSTEQLDEMYGRPAATPAEIDRMSYEDTIVKTTITLAVVVAGAVFGYFNPILYIPFLFVGLALGLVNAFKKQPSAPLVIAYAAAEGIFLGGLSSVVEFMQPGIIFQALIGTGAVFGVTLLLFMNGKVRASKKATKIFMIAGISYAVFSLVNLGLQLTGVNQDAWGLASAPIFGIPLGLIIGPLAILMGAYSLVMNFTEVKVGVDGGAPRKWGWRAAFGIVSTIVWLYLEILRLLSILRGE